MQVITSYIDLFSISQPIYYIADNNIPQLVATVPVDMVGTTIAQFCEKYQTEHAHLYGEEQFITPIVKTIQHQQKDIKSLQEKNKEKDEKINDLEQRLSKLESLLLSKEGGDIE